MSNSARASWPGSVAATCAVAHARSAGSPSPSVVRWVAARTSARTPSA
ncbi:MAG: hypothetical protein R2939_05730 [Kofleriaceae bacterium]